MIFHKLIPTTRQRQSRSWLFISSVLLMVLAASFIFVQPVQATSPSAQQKDFYMPTSQDTDLNNVNWQKTVAQLFNIPENPPAFDKERTADELLASCATWAEPSPPDAMSHGWYRAATTLQETRRKSAEQYQQMLQLYEAAARKGHYTATKQLTILYSQKNLIRYGYFAPEPEKARYWVNVALKRKWVGALEWVATALHQGSAQFPKDTQLSLTYAQLASDMGVPLAQFQMAMVYGNQLKQLDKKKALLQCAARQNLHIALREWAGYNKINDHPTEALSLYQRSVMAGGDAGRQAGAFLYDAFFDKTPRWAGEVDKVNDPIRRQAYRELTDAIDKNNFLKFPRLNDVLPLPPAKVPEWKGIYSAMSPDDAKYYQNPLPPEHYIEEIRQHGVLVPAEYLSQPVMDAK